MPARFNHMELTLPIGQLEQERKAISEFYGDLFDWESLDVDILGQNALLLRTDPETSQFILITEQKKHMQSPGFDHLGLLFENRDEVDAVLEKSKKWQDRDSRVQIQLYDDLVNSDHTTHAFYVKHLLPIWFDVQNQEYANGTDPMREWHFG